MRNGAVYPDLKDKTALVTGGSSGLGRAIVLELVRQGVHVAFTYRSYPGRNEAPQAARVLEGVRAAGRLGLGEELDGADLALVTGFVQRVVEAFGRLDILVNNAGISRDAVVWKMSQEAWDEVLAVNLKQAFNYIHAVAPLFREQGSGKIVNISSTAAFRGRFGLANYAASKAGLIGLTRAVAVELGKYHVNVNAVAPGFIQTPLTQHVPPELLEKARADSALGRLGEPEDVARVVSFLVSEGARHITGEVIRVDGGQLA